MSEGIEILYLFKQLHLVKSSCTYVARVMRYTYKFLPVNPLSGVFIARIFTKFLYLVL